VGVNLAAFGDCLDVGGKGQGRVDGGLLMEDTGVERIGGDSLVTSSGAHKNSGNCQY
jgi:hypothetical protein